MLSVKDNQNTIIIKNSKFICLLYKVDDLKKVDHYLTTAKLEYKDATHYCYAYIINNISKYSDDGEPSKTADFPMLQVLKYNKLNNCLCIVIRYFGKILLGAGGLIRAYSKSVSDCLKDHIIELKEGYNIDIIISYEDCSKLNYILKNETILKKEFYEKITYNLNVTKELYNTLQKLNIGKIIILKNIYL